MFAGVELVFFVVIFRVGVVSVVVVVFVDARRHLLPQGMHLSRGAPRLQSQEIVLRAERTSRRRRENRPTGSKKGALDVRGF